VIYASWIHSSCRRMRSSCACWQAACQLEACMPNHVGTAAVVRFLCVETPALHLLLLFILS
jgi:hypothetical protein